MHSQRQGYMGSEILIWSPDRLYMPEALQRKAGTLEMYWLCPGVHRPVFRQPFLVFGFSQQRGLYIGERDLSGNGFTRPDAAAEIG